MSKTYFGFGIADNMFAANCAVTRTACTPETAKEIIAQGVVVVLNPSHALTIQAMNERFGIHVEIPAKAPIVGLDPGDRILVMSVSGLPRLEGRHEYTQAEITDAYFRFGLWTVHKIAQVMTVIL